MNCTRSIFITFQREGIHCWPDAIQQQGVEFLAHPHRHMFHFKVELEVKHNDREVEFILLKRELSGLYDEGVLKLDKKSCEMLAEELVGYVVNHYPCRRLAVEVSEDGENGARILCNT